MGADKFIYTTDLDFRGIDTGVDTVADDIDSVFYFTDVDGEVHVFKAISGFFPENVGDVFQGVEIGFDVLGEWFYLGDLSIYEFTAYEKGVDLRFAGEFGFACYDAAGNLELSSKSYGWLLSDSFQVNGGDTGNRSYPELLGYEMSSTEVNVYSGSGYHQFVWHLKEIKYVDSTGSESTSSGDNKYPRIYYTKDIYKSYKSEVLLNEPSMIYVYVR